MSGFKSKVAFAAIKGGKPLAELAERFDLHQNQIQDGKKQLLEHADTAFDSSHEQKKTNDAQWKDLHAKILHVSGVGI